MAEILTHTAFFCRLAESMSGIAHGERDLSGGVMPNPTVELSLVNIKVLFDGYRFH